MAKIYQRAYRTVFIVGQVATSNSIELEFTVYTLKSILSCSAPTARKYLNELVGSGLLKKEGSVFKKSAIRYTYHLTVDGMRYFEECRGDYITQLDMIWKQFVLVSSNEK